MPYRRRRRRVYKKKAQGMTLQQGVNTALRVGRLALSMLNTEEKRKDYIPSIFNITNTGIIFEHSSLLQGTSSTTRVGQEIRMKDFFMRYSLSLNAAATSNNVRVIVFLDRQPNGAIPLVTDILQTATYYSPMNALKAKRFKILCDDMYSLSANFPNKFKKCYLDLQKKLKGVDQRTEYKSNLGTPADFSTNIICTLFISNASANYPTGEFYARLKYIDN